MEEKKQPGEALGEFFAGKGFYIVLLLCVGLIAASIWLMADGSRTDVETRRSAAADVTSVGEGTHSGSAPAMPAMKPERTAAPAPAAEKLQELPAPEAPEVQPEPEGAAVSEPEDAAVETMAGELPAVDYFIWPVNGTLLRGHSVEALSYDPTMSDWRVHSGWDIAAALGEPVLCTANGRVTAVSEDSRMGTVVEVGHSNGLVSVYANLAPGCPVSVGQIVRVGSVLGAVGESARAESGQESHLHFALRRDGEDADPADWLPQP